MPHCYLSCDRCTDRSSCPLHSDSFTVTDPDHAQADEHYHAAEGVLVAAQMRPHGVHQPVLGPRTIVTPARNPDNGQAVGFEACTVSMVGCQDCSSFHAPGCPCHPQRHHACCTTTFVHTPPACANGTSLSTTAPCLSTAGVLCIFISVDRATACSAARAGETAPQDALNEQQSPSKHEGGSGALSSLHHGRRRYVLRAALPVGHDCAGSPNSEEHIGDEHVLLVASVQAVGHILVVDDKRPLPGKGLHAHGMLRRYQHGSPSCCYQPHLRGVV